MKNLALNTPLNSDVFKYQAWNGDWVQPGNELQDIETPCPLINWYANKTGASKKKVWEALMQINPTVYSYSHFKELSIDWNPQCKLYKMLGREDITIAFNTQQAEYYEQAAAMAA